MSSNGGNDGNSDVNNGEKEQFTLNDEHKKFLEPFSQGYRVFEGTEESQTKGSKKAYIEQHIAPQFIKEYKLETKYKLESVRDVSGTC
jgi:hypothetical protein